MDRSRLVATVRADLAHALIALDFDGTLAPIVMDPTRSRPVDGALAVLGLLRGAGAQVAVITGRAAQTVVELGGLAAVAGIRVSGLYGVESWFDGHLSTMEEPAALAVLRERLPNVLAATGTDEHVWIEDKRLSLVVHVRRAVDPGAELDSIRESVGHLAAELGLETHDGRQVLEIRIPGFDKGSALRRLVADLGPTVVLFAGDDVGDLPAFEVIAQLRRGGTSAVGVAIASPEAPDVGAGADLQLNSPESLVELLAEIAH